MSDQWFLLWYGDSKPGFFMVFGNGMVWGDINEIKKVYEPIEDEL